MNVPDTEPPRGGSADELPSVIVHPHSVNVVERPEGYRELRCSPAWWSYAEERPLRRFLAEAYCTRTNHDPHGMKGDPDFWSASDAALRLRALPVDDLALRELAILSTRRSVGYNAVKPWVSARETAELARAWERERSDVHWFHQIERSEGTPVLWAQYGMDDVEDTSVVTSYFTRKGDRPWPGGGASPWLGGRGAWYPWALVAGWQRWPRRQEVEQQAVVPVAGRLLLFISHRWEALDYPDPDGRQLEAVQVGLTLALACALLRVSGTLADWHTASGLPEVIARFLDRTTTGGETARAVPRDAPSLLEWARGIKEAASRAASEAEFLAQVRAAETAEVVRALDAVRASVLIWYDYASMYQSPRSAAEERSFREEILQLNAIQRDAATVVIAGSDEYLSRAWCFLELCGGMRESLVELTPSWGMAVEASSAPTRWSSRSDQLIGALNTLGRESINRSGLAATHATDLPDIARLLSQLPLSGMIESDESDLIGGSIPIPRVGGHWVLASGLAQTRRTTPPRPDRTAAALPQPGRLPDGAHMNAGARPWTVDALSGAVGMWVYTTHRALTATWAARCDEMWALLRDHLGAELSERQIPADAAPSVAATSADARALSDDGSGWTRVVPSTVQLLVIVTQDEIPDICRLYERVLYTHLVAGVPVCTYMPLTGRLAMHAPGDALKQGVLPELLNADVLAVPRLRRSSAYPRYFFLPPGLQRTDLDVLAALRLDPSEGAVRVGQTAVPDAPEIDPPAAAADLLAHSELRVRAEALARSTSSSWDTWATPRLHRSAWEVGMAPLQLALIEGVVRRALPVSDNPLERRKLIYIAVEDEQGYALPPRILEDMETVVRMITERR
jgi:hypothetical protein